MDRKIAVVEPKKTNSLSHRVSQAASMIYQASPIHVQRVLPQELRSTLSGGVDLVILNADLTDQDRLQVLRAMREEAAEAAIPVLSLSTETLTAEATAEKIQQLLPRPAGLGLVSTPERERGEWRSLEIEDVAEGMDLPRSTVAHIIGTSERNLARWIAGQTTPRAARNARVQELKYLYYLLKRALKQEAIPRYLTQPNPSLKGRTPLMALREGDFHSVEADLQQLIEGVYE